MIHGQLLGDCVRYPEAIDRYNFRGDFLFLIVMLVLYKYER